jgi:hypothetical protein
VAGETSPCHPSSCLRNKKARESFKVNEKLSLAFFLVFS